MQYLRPYSYFVSKPGGWNNLLLGSAALLSTFVVPILGQLVVLGYMSEVAEDLDRDPETADYADFDFNRFTRYLGRSIWPMVMQLIVGLAVGGLAMLAVSAGVLAGLAANDPIIGFAVGGVLFIPLVLVGSMLSWPMTLHAQLSNGFHFGGAVRFTTSFVRKVGGQMFVSLLVHTLISIPLAVLGLLMCFVGVYAAMMLQVAAQEHYMIQLYRLYLDEGGEPIGGPADELEYDEE